MAQRGDWDEAERGLLEVLGDADFHRGVLGRDVMPTLARLAVRRGRDDAAGLLASARMNVERAKSLRALLATAVAEIEHAWLTDRPELGRAAIELLPRTEHAGRERARGELLRWLRRIGEPVQVFAGCPEEYAAGLRGDWQAAAAAWESIGDPYERALELAESTEVPATLEALTVFDGLGAVAAAAWTRRRLRQLGVSAVPRGPRPATRSNPAGLTDRQVEILALLGDGRTNAEIAAKLVLSVRTVDHHVSAVLQKLGVTTRKQAAAAGAAINAAG
jgi:DNA-binding CsgD family transcriptional regulator